MPKKIVKQKFVVEITMDVEKLKKKYPNFSINYDTPEQFAAMLIANIDHAERPNTYGYKVKVKKSK